jgi:hypothetical protein
MSELGQRSTGGISTSTVYYVEKVIDWKPTTKNGNENDHRVGIVLSFFPSRQNWDSPNPSPAGECALPPPPIPGGGAHSLARERGWESPNSDEGTYTVVLYKYMYFGSMTHPVLLHVRDMAGQSRHRTQGHRKVSARGLSRPQLCGSWTGLSRPQLCGSWTGLSWPRLYGGVRSLWANLYLKK